MDKHFKETLIKKLSIIIVLIVAIFILTTTFRAEKPVADKQPATKDTLETIKKTVPNFPPVVIKTGDNHKEVIVPVKE